MKNLPSLLIWCEVFEEYKCVLCLYCKLASDHKLWPLTWYRKCWLIWKVIIIEVFENNLILQIFRRMKILFVFMKLDHNTKKNKKKKKSLKDKKSIEIKRALKTK